MSQILVRFLVGGAVVSVFAIIGDLLKTEELRRAIRCCAVSRACDCGADGSDRRCILRRH